MNGESTTANSSQSTQSGTAASPSEQSRTSKSKVAEAYARACEHQQEDFQQLVDEVGQAVAHYCRRRPGAAALTVFAVGFFFGWKIKPW